VIQKALNQRKPEKDGMSTIDFAPGGYRFIKGPFQYSAGVAALPGFRLVRVMFAILCRSTKALRGSKRSSTLPGGR
jgi:hypothetical protein